MCLKNLKRVLGAYCSIALMGTSEEYYWCWFRLLVRPLLRFDSLGLTSPAVPRLCRKELQLPGEAPKPLNSRIPNMI